MAGGVITAAWIQAIPVAAAAGAAFSGLTTWRRQLYAQRQIKHAEKAFVAGDESIILTRAIRSRLMPISNQDSSTRLDRARAINELINARVERARSALKNFRYHYLVAELYQTNVTRESNIAADLYKIILELQNHAELMFQLDDGMAGSDSASIGMKQEMLNERAAFFGTNNPDRPDLIEQGIQKAGSDLTAWLKAILSHKSKI